MPYLSFKWWVFLLVPLSLICYADSFIEADKLFSFASCGNKAHAYNIYSTSQWLQAEWEWSFRDRQSRCFTCMRTLHLSAASIYCISNGAPKRPSNSFINQRLQVQLFLHPIRNSEYGLGSFTAWGVRKHKKGGRAKNGSWDDKMVGNYEEELKKN